MNFPIYAIRDSLIGFGMPVIRDNDAVAARSFEYDVTRDGSPYKVRSECYQLYQIGDYSTDDGVVIGCTPRMVCSAVDFVTKE